MPVDIVAVVKGVGAAFTAYLAVRKVVLPLYRKVKAYMSGQADIARIDNSLAAILSELRPNGGNSIRDKINAIDHAVASMRAEREVEWDFAENGMFRADEAGLFTFVSSAFVRWTGRSAHELRGRGWVTIIHPDDLLAVTSGWEAAVRGQRRFETDFRFRTHSGSSFPIHCQSSPLVNASGTVVGYLGVVRRRDVYLLQSLAETEARTTPPNPRAILQIPPPINP